MTTTPTSLFDSLRGTSHWVPYIDARWRAGSDLITQPDLVLNSGVVLMLGSARPGACGATAHRLFLPSASSSGLPMVGMGHRGAVQGWFAPSLARRRSTGPSRRCATSTSSTR